MIPRLIINSFFFEFLPHLHHRKGVEFAVAEQGFAGRSR